MTFYFLNTCPACPEEYTIYLDSGEQVAYVSLRWGILRVETPSYNGNLIYINKFEDNMKGVFESQDERDFYLETITGVLKTECGFGGDVSYKVFNDVSWLSKEIYGDG